MQIKFTDKDFSAPVLVVQTQPVFITFFGMLENKAGVYLLKWYTKPFSVWLFLLLPGFKGALSVYN